MRSRNLQATIVRAAAFYSPNAVNSFAHSTVLEPFRAGKAPQWLGHPHAVNTHTYTLDTGPALAVLGRSPGAYGQTWHLPTTKEPLTGVNFVHLAYGLENRSYKLKVAPLWIPRLMGVLMSLLHENKEMMYQFKHDYRFDSGKIDSAFGLPATPYLQGIGNSWRSETQSHA